MRVANHGAVELTESVEFKSLPSGLHNVEEDLMYVHQRRNMAGIDHLPRYFIHDEEYAGLSAFINKPAAESDRNALMLAVGALLPLSYGRMGKSWKYAEGLKELAKCVRLRLDYTLI